MRVEAANGATMAASVDGDTETQRTATIVFLSLNDVYELLPNLDGQGGVAEFKTLLERTRATIQQKQPLTKIIVTLNGDFLWRSELDRRDKGPAMMQVMQCLGIEYVVLGNHEFDHGVRYLQELLASATFTSFGSNIRDNTSQGTLLHGLVDAELIPLQNGLKLGMFGVCTTQTGKDPFAGEQVRFEDEIAHAKRCVEILRAQGADLIVALTHLKMKLDKQLVRQVPGISLVLGGHDHEPMTEFVGDTMIHKSGQDGLWLGKIQLNVTKHERSSDDADEVSKPRVTVHHEWQMLFNRGYAPHADTQRVVRRYLMFVEEDYRAQGKLVPLATSVTALDGTRFACRRGECNVGNLVTDALRFVLDTDVALIHAGLIKGDLLHPPGLVITQRWLERILPQPRPTAVIEMSARSLKSALEYMMRRFPTMSSSMPQVSGLQIVYDVSDPRSAAGTITSLRLRVQPDEDLIWSDRLLRVALPVVPSLDGWQEFFAPARQLYQAGIVRDIVAQYLTRHAGTEIAYERNEGRTHILEAPVERRG